ncbi:hypothetical protein KJZ61_03375 [Candidatus Dependentiae bacterium]|nr:hypothetical protein [Candidatus Dependentiae bacterium]
MKDSLFLQVSISLCTLVTIAPTLHAVKHNTLSIPHGAKVGPGRILSSTAITTSWQCPYKNCKRSSDSLERIIEHCDRHHYHLHFMVCTDSNDNIVAVSKQCQSYSVTKAAITELANKHPHINATIKCDQERLQCLKEKICGTRDPNMRMRKPACNVHTLQHYKSLLPIKQNNQQSQVALEHQAAFLNQSIFESNTQQTPDTPCQTLNSLPDSLPSISDNTSVNAQRLLQSIHGLDHELVRWPKDQEFVSPAPSVPPLFW